METKYSKKEFDGFTHRFIVRLITSSNFRDDVVINIYSNSDDYNKLNDFILNKKSNKVVSYIIEYRASKEQDEMMPKFINNI